MEIDLTWYKVWWWGSAKLRWSYYEDSSSVFILFIGMELPKEGRLWAYQSSAYQAGRFGEGFRIRESTPKLLPKNSGCSGIVCVLFFFSSDLLGQKTYGWNDLQYIVTLWSSGDAKLLGSSKIHQWKTCFEKMGWDKNTWTLWSVTVTHPKSAKHIKDLRRPVEERWTWTCNEK